MSLAGFPFSQYPSNDPTFLKLERFGYKYLPGGAHSSRTMMLDEISRLVEVTPFAMAEAGYRTAIIQDNVLGKKTETTRQKSLRHLRELYGLSPELPLFAIFRELVTFDPNALDQLAFLVAIARDPLFRATATVIFSAPSEKAIPKEEYQKALEVAFPDQYSALNIAKIGRNVASSWTQSGHLKGHTIKIRQKLQPRPASLSLALLLAAISEPIHDQLFSSPWCRLLDLSPDQARTMAAQAHREGLLDFRAIGQVVDVRFPRFQKVLEGCL